MFCCPFKSICSPNLGWIYVHPAIWARREQLRCPPLADKLVTHHPTPPFANRAHSGRFPRISKPTHPPQSPIAAPGPVVPMLKQKKEANPAQRVAKSRKRQTKGRKGRPETSVVPPPRLWPWNRPPLFGTAPHRLHR